MLEWASLQCANRLDSGKRFELVRNWKRLSVGIARRIDLDDSCGSQEYILRDQARRICDTRAAAKAVFVPAFNQTASSLRQL